MGKQTFISHKKETDSSTPIGMTRDLQPADHT